jgi:hypothetical protein
MSEAAAERHRIFLLSPAFAGGIRGKMLLRPEAKFDLAVRLHDGGLPLGEAFAFISGLYFRGKLAYAEAFAAPPEGIPGTFVISAGHGLVPPETVVTLEQFQYMASIVATLKYLEPIVGVFGHRLLFPEDFVGRGDMSRGGLMLRSARAGVPLKYVPLGKLTRHGPRPPKLPKLPKRG